MDVVPVDWVGGIDDLVVQANVRLAQVLPAERAARPKDEVNARLVRHYTTQGLLPLPGRAGREARYGRAHLLRLLALRRLMADGLGGRSLFAALDGKEEGQLEELARLGSAALDGLAFGEGLEAAREEGNTATRYLQSLKRKASAQAVSAWMPRGPAGQPVSVRAARPSPAAPVPAAALPDFLLPGKLRQRRTVSQVEVQPGLELQVASDFDWPEDEAGWQALLEGLRDTLQAVQSWQEQG